MPKYTKHHPIHERVVYKSHEALHAIRSGIGTIVMPYEAHQQLHAEIPAPCPPALHIAEFVVARFRPRGEDMGDKLQMLIDVANESLDIPQHTQDQERTYLFMENLALQKKFLEDM